MRVCIYTLSISAVLFVTHCSPISNCTHHRQFATAMDYVSTRSCPSRHVVLVAFPFGTHAAPLFALACAIAGAAPAVSLSLISTQRSLESLPPAPVSLSLVPIDDGLPEAADPPASEQERISLFLSALPKTLRAAMDAAVEKARGAVATCVVSDAFMWMAGDEAAEVGAPWIALWTGGPASLFAHLRTDLLRDTVGVGDQVIARHDELLSFVPALSAHRIRDLPEGIVSGEIDSLFSRLLHRIGENIHKAAAVLFNTVRGFDPVIDAEMELCFPNPLHLGPLHLLAPPPASCPAPDAHGCLPWLDGHATASVAYVSFGSVVTPSLEELANLAQGLEASGAAFLWSLRERARELLPRGFLDRTRERGLVVGWAPQQDVLRHPAVGVFVTHCGWNSVLEAAVAGVPMVCRPFFGDQRLNGRTVAAVWGIGVGFEEGSMTEEGAVRVLETVLKSEEGKTMRAKAGELKASAAKAMQPDGSSMLNFNTLLGFAINSLTKPHK
ncbi:anthocyanidin 3-O-glucosyltransferase 7-like [Zingiber officinale]|nr:anthocyanidin 3-O-glucosyltransferase 7-like [Zingiber officinale]